MSPRGVAVFGCTGSIGDTTFKVLEGLALQPEAPDLEVVALSAGGRVAELITHSRRWRPSRVCVGNAADVALVKAALPGVDVVCGADGLESLAADPQVDVVVNGLVGAVGLRPTLAALHAGTDVAMANKEPLVMVGNLVLEAAERGGGRILPVDSEPSAMWQCLNGERAHEVTRLILTASGGAFRDRSREQLSAVTPEEALNHPTWNMGPKITVDSATLMNKGFEVIEASWLFNVHVDAVEVVIHRESIVHSMVEFVDGSIIAHLGRTDMSLPIQYALTEPERYPGPPHLDLTELGALHFEAPDLSNFPALELCYRVGRLGGTMPVALNAANEVGVAAFLSGRIGFLQIHNVNELVVEGHNVAAANCLGTVLEVDRQARECADRAVCHIEEERRGE
ncbi:MAG: 1-deoxy-D-xylulose-5-phosphate reductoisomerase [Candidatus Latescibacterota bacterium]|nr:1-deoxy-D-xylulose-5-phosphate reductoisomerase [Candidatus Latescibacterota bacterium]